MAGCGTGRHWYEGDNDAICVWAIGTFAGYRIKKDDHPSR